LKASKKLFRILPGKSTVCVLLVDFVTSGSADIQIFAVFDLSEEICDVESLYFLGFVQILYCGLWLVAFWVLPS
jgi:hypothetical protein